MRKVLGVNPSEGDDEEGVETRSARATRDASVLGGSIGRSRPGPDRRALIGSATFHLALVLALFASGLHRRTLPDFEVYQVKLYSPPAQVEAPVAEPVAVTAPIRAPRTAERIPEPTRTPPPPPRPQTVTPPPPPPPERPPPREPEPVRGPEARASSAGGENVDVDIEGQQFPYPAYLENIILQLNRYFRWSGSPRLEAQVVFFINRDGSTGGLRVLDRSGDFNFDLQAANAVEQAGQRGAFGPLPEGWVQDRLWVRYRFLPPGR